MAAPSRTPSAVITSATISRMITEASGPYFEQREQAEHERKGERKPAPLADRGIAEADAGDEEQEVGDDAAHGRLIPRRGKDESGL